MLMAISIKKLTPIIPKNMYSIVEPNCPSGTHVLMVSIKNNKQQRDTQKTNYQRFVILFLGIIDGQCIDCCPKEYQHGIDIDRNRCGRILYRHHLLARPDGNIGKQQHLGQASNYRIDIKQSGVFIKEQVVYTKYS